MISHIGQKYINAAEFAKLLKHRRWRFTAWAIVLSAIATAIFLSMGGNLAVPVGIISSIVLITIAWLFPRSMFFVMLIGSCVVETFPLKLKDSFTDLIPLFWDVNTIVQVYLQVDNFHGIALSFFEILLIVAGLAWIIRGVYFRTLHFKFGTLFVPIALYAMCVFGGLLNGLATGGAFNIALFEVRAQIYFLFAYLMAINSVQNVAAQTTAMLWASALGIGFKGLLSTFRFLVTFKGVTIPEVGIGSHEESFFFDCFIFQLMVLKLANIHPTLRTTMLILLPTVLIADLANQRRAATAALAIALIIMLFLAAFAFPKRQAAIALTAILISIGAAIYLPLFWNGTGTFAQPARAIKSQFSPDPRDASSNEYRDAENANLVATMKTSPIIGYGYGKPILEPVPMVDLTTVDPFVHFMTHNQILWVWMRLGIIGFYFFWIMVTSIIIQGCRVLRNPNAPPEAKAAALLAVLIIAMQMVFGLLDLQISNVRNMLYCGLWAGMVSIMTSTYRLTDAKLVTNGKYEYAGRLKTRWNLPEPEQVHS